MDAIQIRAARAMLDWTRKDLANNVGLHHISIQKIEDGKTIPHEASQKALQAVFEAHGIEFLPGSGVRMRDRTIAILEGSDAYLKLMDDIYHTLREKGGELLFLFADDRVTTEEGRAAEERLRSAGITFRTIIEGGNTVINGPTHEYRAVPTKFFNHDLVVIYSNKVAQLIDKGAKIVIIENDSFAATMRKTFDFMWQSLRPFTV